MTVITLPGVKLPPDTPPEPGAIEPAMAPEFFVSDLARVDVLGPFARLIFAAREFPIECDGKERASIQLVVNCKIVMPTEVLAAICEKIGKHLPVGTDGAPK